MEGPSIARRAALAVLLTAGYYLLVIGMCLGLVAVPIVLHGVLHVRLAFFKVSWIFLAAAWALFISALPRRAWQRPRGVRVDSDHQPRLFALLDDVARATGEPVPHVVLLTADMNASVFGLGGRFGKGATRHMTLGLPLLQLLDERELRAVIAHEFGHFVGGDTRLGPWIHATRASLGRSIADMGRRNAVLQAPFAAYGKLFLRVTHSVSRAQEYEADKLSARVAGAGHAISALRKIHTGAAAFEGFLQGEFHPVLQSGHRAPLLEGFERFLKDESVREQLQVVARESAGATHDPYDTHPSLAERTAALEALESEGTPQEPTVPALALLDDLKDVEWRALASSFKGVPFGKLEEIPWSAVAERVRLPEARQLRGFIPPGRLDGVRLGDLGDACRNAGALGSWLCSVLRVEPRPVEEAALARLAISIVSQCVLATLSDAGWKLEVAPGGATLARREGIGLAPFPALRSVERGEVSSDEWRARCAAAGIAELLLLPPRDGAKPKDAAPQSNVAGASSSG